MNEKIIALLERTLAQAKAGKLEGLGLITVFEQGGLQVQQEGHAAFIVLGAVQLQEQVRASLFDHSRPTLPGLPGGAGLSS